MFFGTWIDDFSWVKHVIINVRFGSSGYFVKITRLSSDEWTCCFVVKYQSLITTSWTVCVFIYLCIQYPAGNTPYVNSSEAMNRRHDGFPEWSPNIVLATICCMCSFCMWAQWSVLDWTIAPPFFTQRVNITFRNSNVLRTLLHAL